MKNRLNVNNDINDRLPCLRDSSLTLGMTKIIMRREYNFYVYIVASSSGTIYIGVTNNLLKRITEHKEGKIKGFTQKYSCKKIVYYEHFENVYDAISREKEIKKWRREKKENLIKQINPHWNDLYLE